MSSVDVVFTWVDGGDPRWRERFQHWVAHHDTSMGPDATDPARYRDNDELRFALRSIAQYAPWARRIHVVTAGHAPSWLDVGHPRIRLVAHREIFSPSDLPTFNSHAIEARLHHIPELADRFVYCNDDVFLARPQPVSNYFSADGAPLVSMTTNSLPDTIHAASATCDHAAVNGARLLQRELGAVPAGRPCHGPFAQRRTFLEALAERFGPELAATSAQRFRSPTDVSLPTFLAPMYGLATGRAGVSPSTVAEINVDDADLPARLAALGPDTRDDSFCLNDTERVMPGPDGPRGLVTTFLRRRFPTPAPWELDADDPGRALDYTATSVPPPELTSATAFASSSASSLAR